MARILTVDDSVAMRQMVSMTLVGAGHEVVQAGDGAAALELAAAQPMDLIITDVNMPNMDGLSLVRALREMPGYRLIPILMLTTEVDPQKKQQGASAGATGWLVKPFNPDRLLATIDSVLANQAKSSGG